MVPLGEQKQEEVAQTYKTSCRYVTYSRFGKLCLIVKEYIVILFLKVICFCAMAACIFPTGLESTYSLVSSVMSCGTMTTSLCNQSFSSRNAHACLGPQINLACLSVTSWYEAWPTFPPEKFSIELNSLQTAFNLIPIICLVPVFDDCAFFRMW